MAWSGKRTPGPYLKRPQHTLNCRRSVRIEKIHLVQVCCRRTKCIDWQSERSPNSLPLLASLRGVDHRAVSETRTASGRSDDHSSPGFHVADAEYLGGSLAPAVLGGAWCALAPQNSPRGSARRSVLGSATSVASPKRLCSIASSAKIWRPSSSKRRSAIPAASFPPLFAPSLSATCAAGCSAMASPEFVVRLAMMSCWWRFSAKIGVSVHHALGDGWPTLRHIFETMCFPPLQFGSGS